MSGYAARNTDPETSHEALEGMDRHEDKVFDILFLNPEGLTYREASELTGINGTSTSTVISKLMRDGLVEEANIRRNGCRVRRLAL